MIHRRLGNDQEAGAYDTILAEHHLETGLKFYKADNLRAAESHLKEAIESDPQHESALYFFGRVQYGLGSFVESKQTLLKLIELDPNHLDGWHWLANSYVATGDFEKAKEGYGEALRINSRYAASYVAVGLIAVEEDALELSLDYFERAYTMDIDGIEVGGTGIRALRKLIEVHRRLGNDQEAEAYAEQLREWEG